MTKLALLTVAAFLGGLYVGIVLAFRTWRRDVERLFAEVERSLAVETPNKIMWQRPTDAFDGRGDPPDELHHDGTPKAPFEATPLEGLDVELDD